MKLKEKMVRFFQDKARKHPYLKAPVIVLIACIVWFYHLAEGLKRNRRRCGLLACVILVFVFFSWFSPHAEEKNQTIPVMTEEVAKSKDSGNESMIVMADIPSSEGMGMKISDYAATGEEPADESDIDEFIKKNTVTQELSDSNEEGQAISQPSDEIVIYNENGEQLDAAFADDWKLILVNKQNLIPENYHMSLTSINGSMQVDSRIASDLAKMLSAAKEDGVSLMICSAYRSFDRQTVLFENKIKRMMKSGMSYLDAYADASYSVTVPGTSEHELGMALDIVTPSYTSLNEGFENTEAGQWLRRHSAEFGFILRYPKEKEHITGIIYEPWHFRYVGVVAAEEITDNGLTLEEYLNQIGMK